MTDGTTRGVDHVFRIGLIGNAALAALKLGVGWIAGSVSLVADGWHSMSDIGTNAGAWLAHRLARRPPDEDHHYGHGNVEALAGLVLGILIGIGGVAVAWGSYRAEIQLVEGRASLAAIGVAILSICGNLTLAVITFRAGRREQSHSLAALARDNGSDALASVLVVLAIFATRAGIAWAEPLVGIVIGVLIVWLGWRSARDGFDVLMDRVADPSIREKLRAAARGVPGVAGVQAVRIHPMGTHFRVDVEVSVDGALTVQEGHEIAHQVESAVTATELHVEGVHVHVNPAAPSDATDG